MAAWHGNKATVASYRAPNADAFGAHFTIATRGKPQFVRAAIGADGTAAVSTWLPDVPNSQVIGRITPSQTTFTLVPAPSGGTNAHIAVGPNGTVTAAELIVTSPTDQKLNVYTLPAASSTFSAPTTVTSLAAPFTGFDGFTLVGNGQGAYVVGWTLLTGVSSQTRAFASYSSNGTTWSAPETVGTAPSTLGEVALDGSGNALATYTGGAQLQSVFRSYLDNQWRSPTPVPSGGVGAIGFDLPGNAAVVGTSATGASAYTVRSVGSGAYSPAQALQPSGGVALAVSPAGDTLVLRQSGSSLTSSWGSTLTASTLGNTEPLPGTGTRTLVGAGLDQNSLGTAVWASSPGSGLGSVFASTRPAGAGGEVTLSTGQLLTNQRISQAAVLRSNAVRDRLNQGLTAAQIGTGVITSANLLPGLSFGPLGANSPGTPITVPSANTGSGANVTLSAQQLLINQRISQVAVRRANLNIASLQAGLTQNAIAPGGISSQNVKPQTTPQAGRSLPRSSGRR